MFSYSVISSLSNPSRKVELQSTKQFCTLQAMFFPPSNMAKYLKIPPCCPHPKFWNLLRKIQSTQKPCLFQKLMKSFMLQPCSLKEIGRVVTLLIFFTRVTNNEWWSEWDRGRWWNIPSSNNNLHDTLHSTLSNLSFILARPFCELVHVNFGPLKPKSTSLHLSINCQNLF